MNLDALNLLTRDEFISAIGWVFEHSPWGAERTWSGRPFATIDALHKAMVDQVQLASPEEQMALLRSHPDLGTRARISDASTSEQAGAGLDRLTPHEFDLLQRLNAEYRGKYGFPFLYAVKGSTKSDILKALEERLGNTPEQEYREALDNVFRIARFRLEDSVL